jgi:hypothetical protein
MKELSVRAGDDLTRFLWVGNIQVDSVHAIVSGGSTTPDKRHFLQKSEVSGVSWLCSLE